MSRTIVVDEASRERSFENRLNEVYRHCRIGRIVPKLVPMAPIAPINFASPVDHEWWRLPVVPAIYQPGTAHPPKRWENPIVTC